MHTLTIVKVGGAVVEDEAQLRQLLKDFTAIEGRKLLVHGGGRRATQIAAQLGIETRMVDGRRITDEPMLQVVTMVYGGLVNKHIVASLQALGHNAVGLTGADGDTIRSHRRPPVPVKTASPKVEGASTVDPQLVVEGMKEIDYGFVGDVDRVNAGTLSRFIESGIIPVMAPLTHDGQGSLLNTNADTIASTIAKAMAGIYDVTLIYAFEKAGVLRQPDDDTSVIPVITPSLFHELKADGTISGGMLPKIDNALRAVAAGVSRVIITSSTAIDGRHGTTILP